MVMATNEVDVLVAVDALGASQPNQGGLQNNVYLIDTNQHMGSGREGQSELVTACSDGQMIKWTITPIDPDDDIAITGFKGQMISDGVCVPVQVNAPSGPYWEGRVEARDTTGQQQYSMVVKIDGQDGYTFDPFLQIS